LKSLKFLLPLGIFLVLVVFLAVGLNLNPREVPSPLIGKPAPAFTLTRLDAPAQSIKRDELLGKVWILNVWASWCAPCREEHPVLVEFARRKLVPIYGLNYKDTRPAGCPCSSGRRSARACAERTPPAPGVLRGTARTTRPTR